VADDSPIEELSMSRDISEPDWKVFRKLREIALERFCQRIVSEIECVAADTTKTAHDRYLAIFELIHQRNEDVAAAFDNPRRSAALLQLACIQSHKLLTDDEMSPFSNDIREAVKRILSL
jgi:hypothetical protein